jgi:hypothetical protein
VEKIVTRPTERFILFRATTAEEQAHIKLAIDQFLQEAVLIIEDLPTLRKPILRIIGNLSEVSEGSVGQKCILVIQDLIDSGPDIAKHTKEVIESVIIPKLMKDRLETISKDLLIGIISLFEAHNLAGKCWNLIDKMEVWVRHDVETEVGLLTTGETDEEYDEEKHIAALQLIAVAALDDDNSSRMAKKSIPQYIARLLKIIERKSEPGNLVSGQMQEYVLTANKLIAILNIIERTARNNDTASETYVTEEIH